MSEARNIRILDSKEKACDFIINVWAQKARTALDQRGFFSVALSGGKTPVDFSKAFLRRKVSPGTRLTSSRSMNDLCRRMMTKATPV